MGQGHHGGILFGALINKQQETELFGEDYDENGHRDAYEQHRRGRLPAWPEVGSRAYEKVRQVVAKDSLNLPDHHYETKQPWIGFWVADIDPIFSEWEESGNPIRGGDLRYTALPLTEAGVRARFGPQLDSAVARWNEFATFCAGRGFEIAGELLIVTDWD